MSTNKNKPVDAPRSPSRTKSGNREWVGGLIAVLVVVAIPVSIILFNNIISSNANKQLRAAVVKTCEATVKNYEIESKNYAGGTTKLLNSDGIESATLQGDDHSAVFHLWATNYASRQDDSEHEDPCTENNGENSTSAVDDFMQYVKNNNLSANELMSGDKKYLNKEGQDIFIKSLRLTYGDRIQKTNDIIKNVKSRSYQINVQ